MYLYRYEHPDSGKGPYTHHKVNEAIHQMREEHAWCDCHPGPGRDFLTDNYHYPSQHIYGCSSIKSLKKWFLGFNKAIKAAGFKIVRYSFPIIAVGNHQRAIKKDYLKKAHKVTINA